MVAGGVISRRKRLDQGVPKLLLRNLLKPPSEEQELGGFASPSSRTGDDLVDVAPHVELVTKVMEGLRRDAFLMAKDLGLDVSMDVGPPTGLEELVERIKERLVRRPMAPLADSPLRQSCHSLADARDGGFNSRNWILR